MPRKKTERRKTAHAGYPGKDVGEPNLGEREFETGADESWKAGAPRTHNEYQHESLSDIRSHRKHIENLNTQVIRMLTNCVSADSERSERVNQANMQATANIDQSNDTMLALLVEALKQDGEATITISRPKKKA